MFSGRIPSEFHVNRLTAAVAEKRRRGAPLLDLTVSNPTRVGLPSFDPSILAEAAAASTGYHPDPAGSLSAREAVAACYAARGVEIDPKRIILTASTSEAYSHLFKLLADPGGEFLAPAPSYPLFEPLAALEAVDLRFYPLRFDGRWWLDRAALAGAISERSRGLIVVEPNNPTGSVLNGEERAAVSRLCARAGLAVIADEVFGDFMADNEPRPPRFALEPDVLSFTLSGLSKVAGLPQMKLGWIIVSGPEEMAARAVEGLEWIADTFLSVSTPVQAMLPRLLTQSGTFQSAAQARIGENEARLRRALAGHPAIEMLPREGGWSIVLRVPRVRSEEEWCLALLEKDVILHPGHFYDFEQEAYLVGSLITPAEEFGEGIRRLVAVSERP